MRQISHRLRTLEEKSNKLTREELAEYKRRHERYRCQLRELTDEQLAAVKEYLRLEKLKGMAAEDGHEWDSLSEDQRATYLSKDREHEQALRNMTDEELEDHKDKLNRLANRETRASVEWFYRLEKFVADIRSGKAERLCAQ